MNTIIQKVMVPNDRRMSLTIELPDNVPVGEAVMTVTIESEQHKNTIGNRIGDLFGRGKGEVWMADDFDVPLEEFEEYM